MKKIAVILALSALFLLGLSAQDTITLNGTTQINFALRRQVKVYYIGCTEYTTRATARVITGVGTVVFRADGSGYIKPVAGYAATWKYYYASCSLLTRNLVIKQPSAAAPPAADSYTLSVASTTSAGVYQNGKLVRTLWSNVRKAAGTHIVTWDNKNDAGATVTGHYDIKVISHQMTYEWKANIGNTSSIDTGVHKLKGLSTPYAGVEVGNFIYYAKGASEGQSPLYKINKSNPNYSYPIRESGCGDHDMETKFAATDGTRVYFAGYDAWTGYWNPNNPPTDTNSRVKSMVYALTASTDADYIFSSGTLTKGSLAQCNTYSAAGIIYDDNNALPTGLAVMSSGDYMYTSHYGKTWVRCYNKLTGAVVGTYNILLGRIAIEGSFLYGLKGDSIKKYAIESNGTLTPSAAAWKVTGALNISVKNGIVLIVDGHNMQVKAYNTTGEALWTLGQSGGYRGSPSAANDKFWFKDFNNIASKGFIIQQSDTSFWVGDAGNCRTLHFTKARAHIETSGYLPMNYNCGANKTEPTRVFAGLLEYDAITGNLVKNWSARLPASFNYVDNRDIFSGMTTISGRTFAIMRYYPSAPLQDGNVMSIVELRDTGIRYLNIHKEEHMKYNMDANGDLYHYEGDYFGTSGSGYIVKEAYTGITDNMPTWGAPSNYLTIPLGAHNPFYGCDNIGANSKGVIFSQDKVNTGYHLGRVSGGQWVWQTCPSTTVGYEGGFPGDGRFDIGNGVEYAGKNLYSVDSLFVWNYIGEFWKLSQTNKWNMYHQDGLMLMQLGKTRPEADAYSGGYDAPREGAGNMLGAAFVKIGSDYWIFYCDENAHSAIGRFKISGANTIQIHTLSY